MRKIFLLVIAVMILTTAAVFAAESEPYTYVSREYNYSIECPKRPNIVPASILLDDESKKGEVLIFENEGYSVKNGWIILVDAFNTNAVPDFNKDSKDFIEKYLTELKKNRYESTSLIDIGNGNKGVLAITAKEIEVDEDGDGTIDGVLTTDRQEAVVFFRMPDGQCFSIEWIGDYELNDEKLNNFKMAVSTIKDANASTQNVDSKDKKSNKDKKDKKDKKNKKDKKS